MHTKQYFEEVSAVAKLIDVAATEKLVTNHQYPHQWQRNPGPQCALTGDDRVFGHRSVLDGKKGCLYGAKWSGTCARTFIVPSEACL